MKFLKKFATRAEYEAYMADNMENYPHVGYIADEGAVEYVKEAPPRPERMPLHFEAIEDMTVSFSTNAIEYSLDNETWQTLPAATATPTISAGSKVYFRASGLTPNSSTGIGQFSTTGKFNAVGNVMSMISGADFAEVKSVKENGLRTLFKSCTGLINADQLILPATTLAPNCYTQMFRDCTSLVAAPILPATTMKDSCYYRMFDGCTSLVNAPELPATTLASSCYSYMFSSCSSLQYIKAMFTTTPGSSYTAGWVSGVKSVGTFVKNAAATWDVTGDNGIPSGWTIKTATE